MIIKKYGNRRLYDTEASRYITLEDLEASIRGGAEVHVVDAKTGADLTQVTLTQIIIEGRKADRILPSALLHQLIRLGDDALSEFLGRYLSAALETYLHARRGTQSLLGFNPFAAMNPFGGAGGLGLWGAPPVQAAPPAAAPAPSAEIEALRREMEALKKSLRKRKK